MPELPVKEVRLSELHLPEIKRDEIVRSLSEVRLPTVDLTGMARPKIDLPDAVRRFDWRSIDLSGAVAGAAAIARLGRPIIRRSRWVYVTGAIVVVGAVSTALLANPAVRERAGRTIRDLRTRMENRTGSTESLEVDADAPIGTAPIMAAAPPVEAAAPVSESVPFEVATPMADVVAGGAGQTVDDGSNGLS